jgi:hypothetical protein
VGVVAAASPPGGDGAEAGDEPDAPADPATIGDDATRETPDVADDGAVEGDVDDEADVDEDDDLSPTRGATARERRARNARETALDDTPEDADDRGEIDDDLPDFDALDEAADAAALAAKLDKERSSRGASRTATGSASRSASARAGKGASSKKGTAAPAKAVEGPPLPARDERCAYRTPIWEHVVASGEHLGGIAGRYGVTRRDLLALNPTVTNPDVIRIGQRLLVCPEIAPRGTKTLVHVVSAGESQSKIAKRYGLTLDELRAQLADGRPSDTKDGDASDGRGDPSLLRVGARIELTLDDGIVRGFRPEDLVRKPESVAHVEVAPTVTATARLPEGPGYRIKRPNLAFGSERTVELLVEVFARYRKRAKGGPLINVGDISRRGGGHLKGHRSHRRGVDVDIGLVLKGEQADESRFINATPENLDVRRTWLLVRALLETDEVRYIFLDYRVQAQLYEYALEHGVDERQLDEWFQYPRGIGRNHGIVRHWRNHRNHLHVRFR